MSRRSGDGAGGSGAVAGTLEDTEKFDPGADGAAVLMRDEAGDLMEMRHVVGSPGSEKLGQSDGTERGMTAATGEVCRLEM